MMKTSVSLVAALLFFSGCATSTITNLTPTQQMRNPDNLYPFEVAFDTRQQALRQETLRPSVVIGFDFYPMDPAPMLPNRWETLVPIPPDTNLVHYRFRFDYEYLAVPQRQAGSKLSPTYQLQILDRSN